MGICFRFFHSRPPPPSSPRTPGKCCFASTMRSTIKVSVMQRSDMFGWLRPLPRSYRAFGSDDSPSLTPQSVLMILGSLTGENLINLGECRQTSGKCKQPSVAQSFAICTANTIARFGRAEWKSVLLALTFRCAPRCM
jgi:hypothetical protein